MMPPEQLSLLWRAPDSEIVLRSTITSPFGRKVRMAAELLELSKQIRREDADTRDETDSLRQQNPLGKMPCLLIGRTPIYDSRVILELLDEVAGGGRLFPRAGLERFRTLSQACLADGITDAALLMVYEARFRNEGAEPARHWLSHQRGKVHRGLAAFEAAPPSAEKADLVSISLAAALGYLDWRRPVTWRDGYPGLVAWLEQFEKFTPAYSLTEGTAP